MSDISRKKAIRVIQREIDAATKTYDNPLDHCQAGSQVEHNFRALISVYQQLIKLLESDKPQLGKLNPYTMEESLLEYYVNLSIRLFHGDDLAEEMNNEFKEALITLGKHLCNH